MSEWTSSANRGLVLFEGSADDSKDRMWQILNHVLDENNNDDYISKDFFNVQQTAGGLPDGIEFIDFLQMIAGHVRQDLTGSNFNDEVGDDDFTTAALAIDATIRRHIGFLNGVVHQGAPGDAHLGLWNYILQSRDTPQSIYSLYKDYLVDA